MTQPIIYEKMPKIVESLWYDPRVTVVGGLDRFHLQQGDWPHPGGAVGRILSILIYPKTPLHDTLELNNLLGTLVPEIEPNHVESVEHFRPNMPGRLSYDEAVGITMLSATVTIDPNASGATAKKWLGGWNAVQTHDILQRTYVSMFPCAESAGESKLTTTLRGSDDWLDGEALAASFHITDMGRPVL